MSSNQAEGGQERPERFFMGGRRWIPVTQEYFETVIVDFFGRPGGWWHDPMLYEQPGRFGLHITPKPHENRNGFTRDYNNQFRPCRWQSMEEYKNSQP